MADEIVTRKTSMPEWHAHWLSVSGSGSYVLCLLVIVVVVCVGMGTGIVLRNNFGDEIETWKNKARIRAMEPTPVQLCIKYGGVPVKSIWDGRLADCIFPGQQK